MDASLKNIKKDAAIVEKVGEIEIEIHRSSEGKQASSSPAADVQTSLRAKVHEKALKGEARSHNIS